MKAVVMAGGEGTRLRPLTLDVPKPFIRVAGKPAVEYALDALVAAGIKDIIVTTFYKPERLIQHLSGGARLKARIFYSVEDEAMGTAGGVAKCLPLTGNDTVVVLSGDVIADVNIKALVEAHKKSGAVATMALTRVENVSEFGIVGLDETGRIIRFKEKPKTPEETFSNLINTGIYVLEPEALRAVPEGATFDFSKQLFPKLLESGKKLQGVPIEGFWMDVGRPSDLIKASEVLGEKHGKKGGLREGAKVDAKAKLARVDCYPGSAVEAGASLEDCLLYDGARVEADAVLKQTILAPDAVVGKGARLTDCVIGRGAKVKPGATLTGVKVEPGQTAGGEVYEPVRRRRSRPTVLHVARQAASWPSGCMQAKLEQVRRLLREGYALEDVVEDGLVMEAVFSRGAKRASVRFLPSEAEALLLSGPLRLPR